MVFLRKLPIVLHIPHSSRLVPAEYLPDIRLSASELDKELLLMTDAYTEEAAAGNWAAGVVLSQVSRLVVDVERFRSDSEEEMAGVGMGAVYEKTQNGQPLRSVSSERREEMLRRYYDSHHAKFAWTVSEMLEKFQRCLILDVHTFPSRPLPYEADQSEIRPDICIGTDPYHTPRRLAEAANRFFAERGWLVEENRPFSGSIVPLTYYERDRRVFSIMVEINRALIMDESTGAKKEAATNIFGLFPDFAKRLLAVL